MVTKCVDEKSQFAKIFGQRVPIIIIFLGTALIFFKLGDSSLAGISLGVAVVLGKDYNTAVSDEKVELAK